MLIPLEFIQKKRGLLDPVDYEDSLEHAEFTERLRKTLYYGKTPTTDRPSLPVTELAVGFFKDAAPRELGRVDLTYASDVSRQACISPCSMMLGMIYVDRLKHRNPEYLQQVSSSDLFLISMMMASKYLYDEGVDEEVFNDEWAESAEMDIEDVNSLECAFLKAIDWALYVNQTDFFDLLQRIERKVAWDKGREHGFLTYSDLMVLSDESRVNQALLAILRELAKVMLVCSVAYVAGILTMFGSTVALATLQQAIPGQPLVTDTNYVYLPGLTPSPLNTHKNPHLADTPRSDAKISTTHTDQISSRPSDNMSTTTGAIGMKGLLTLALMKDTVVQFLMGMKGGEQESYLPMGYSLDQATAGDDTLEMATNNMVCTCGCCVGPVSSQQHCMNVSIGEKELSNLHPAWRMDLWTTNQDHQHASSSAKMDLKCDMDSHCCCTRLHQWQRDQVHQEHAGHFGVGGRPLISRHSQMKTPFHNVVHGFWTTAETIAGT